jgi:nucleotide-binding universal stress UspA family protein
MTISLLPVVQLLLFDVLQDVVLGTALTDTDAALNLALSAMSLATTMCDSGSPEAADKALEFAEQALTMTVQRLAKAQMMVLHKVEQQQDQGVPLPKSAADIARSLAATVAAAGAGSSSSAAAQRRDTAAVQDTKEAGGPPRDKNDGDS